VKKNLFTFNLNKSSGGLDGGQITCDDHARQSVKKLKEK